MLPEEITTLLLVELDALAKRNLLPDGWRENKYFVDLMACLVPSVISTQRDVKRLVGNFHVLYEMVRGEVSWVDVLGYSAFRMKAPVTDNNNRRNPEKIVLNPSYSEYFEIFSKKEKEEADVEKWLFAKG